MKAGIRRLGLCAIAMVAAACTALELSPPVDASVSLELRIPGSVEYDGSDQYRPTVLSGANGPGRFVYSTEIAYTNDDTPPLIVLFNPLTLLGFPSGTAVVTTTAELEVLRGDQTLQRYRAKSVLTQRKSLYSAESQTSLRRRSLLAVRDSIDVQVVQDAAVLLRQLEP